eukprot:4873586-Ditylum_brightwellii.AAC.1
MWKPKHCTGGGGGAEGRISMVVKQEQQQKGKIYWHNSIIKSNSSPACPVAPPVCPVILSDLTFDYLPSRYNQLLSNKKQHQISPILLIHHS